MYRHRKRRKRRNRWILLVVVLLALAAAAFFTRKIYLPLLFPREEGQAQPTASPTAFTPDATATSLPASTASGSSLGADYAAEPDPEKAAALLGAKLAPQARTTYALDIDVDAENNVLRCMTQTDIANPSDQPLSELMFTVFADNGGLAALSDAGKKYVNRQDASFTLERVLVNGAQVNAQAENNAITILLPFELAPGDRVRVTFAYTLGLPFTAYDYGHNSRGINAAWFYPVPARFDGDVWVRDPFSPTGAPLTLEAADYAAAIHLPSDYSLSCTGRVTNIIDGKDRKTYLVEAVSARDFAFHADNRTNRRLKESAGVEISSRTASEEKIALMDQYAGQIVAAYADLFGPCPVPALSIAQSSLWTDTSAHDSLILVDYNTVAGGAGIFEQALARAIAKQWFGCSVGASADGQWLNDALCEYATIAYVTGKRGVDMGAALYNSRIKTALSGSLSKLKNDMHAASEAQSKQLSFAGAALLYDLSKKTDPQKFHAALRSYAEKYAHGQGSLRALVKEIEAADPALAPFLAQRVDVEAN